MYASCLKLRFPCIVASSVWLTLAQATTHGQQAAPPTQQTRKQIIGAVAKLEEQDSELKFAARVDTGATTTSIHVDKWFIEQPARQSHRNVGKPISFRVTNEKGQSSWIRRRIVDYGLVKTSEDVEHRYKVHLTLRCHGVEKRVLVSLNDRSHMQYPVLLGRNFLEGDFLVDVEL